MKDIEVNISSISNMQKQIGEAVKTLDSSLKTMYEGVAELNRTWEGPNHTDFVTLFEQRYEEMKKLGKTLESYQKVVKEAGKTYDKCEQEVYQLVQSI